MRNVYVTVGKVCSGKDFFADNAYPDAVKIDIGTIVRSIMRQQLRVHNKTLDLQIMQEVQRQISQAGEKDVVITGIRQLSIYQWLLNYCSAHMNLKTFHLVCPMNILKKRFAERQHEKDFGIEFEEVIKRDGELGLDELEAYVKKRKEVITVNSNINAEESI